MKHFSLKAILCGCICFALVLQTAISQEGIPELPDEVKPFADVAIVIDVKAEKGAKNTVVLKNHATNLPVNYVIHCYNKTNGWKVFGGGVLKRIADSARVFRMDGIKDVVDYDYLVVIPFASSGGTTEVVHHKEKFSHAIRVSNDDIYVYLLPENLSFSNFESKATVFDVSNMQKKIKDNVRFVSDSKKNGRLGFLLFGDDGNGFEFLGSAFLKGFSDTSFLDVYKQDFSVKKYSKFAVVSVEGKKLKYKTEAKSNDLYITITD